eukprot:6180521-Pleurochrysis_carterae.AAC.1
MAARAPPDVTAARAGHACNDRARHRACDGRSRRPRMCLTAARRGRARDGRARPTAPRRIWRPRASHVKAVVKAGHMRWPHGHAIASRDRWRHFTGLNGFPTVRLMLS